MTWDRDSRRHSLAAKGVSTAKLPEIVKPMSGEKPWDPLSGEIVKEFNSNTELFVWIQEKENVSALKERFPPENYNMYVDRTSNQIIAKKKR